jgi:ferredoxin--NADP+ reductase
VVMLGRRGPLQAAFTNAEVRELGELEGADVVVRADECALDPLSQAALEAGGDRTLAKKMEILNDFACRQPTGKPRRLVLRFLVSPVELLGDAAGRVRAMKVVRNRLVADGKGGLRPQATGEIEEWPVGLVFRSVGYRGVALPGLPFDERRGIVPNQEGRVLDAGGGAGAADGPATPLVGLYVAGWIKRGPTGVIGTNKPDAAETVEAMLEDAAQGRALDPAEPDEAALEALVRQRQPAVVSYADWLALERLEQQRGAPAGRPRVKLTSVAEMLAALRAGPTGAP